MTLKGIRTIFSISFLLAVILFLYARKQDMYKEEDKGYLKKEERRISTRMPRLKEKELFVLCSYPSVSSDSYVKLYTHKDYKSGLKDKILRIVFSKENKYLHGLHFGFTFALHSYLDYGSLEFYVKQEGYSDYFNNLEVYLKEGLFKDSMVKCPVRTRIHSVWRKVSIPLNHFFIYEGGDVTGNKKFSWEIQEVLFSTSSLDVDKIIIFIKNIIIRDKNNIIYEIL